MACIRMISMLILRTIWKKTSSRSKTIITFTLHSTNYWLIKFGEGGNKSAIVMIQKGRRNLTSPWESSAMGMPLLSHPPIK